MFEREISARDIRNVLTPGEVIEDYPDDKPFPSRLIAGQSSGRPIHVVAAWNCEDDQTIVITVYQPDLDIFGARVSEEKNMKCTICRQGETRPGKTTVTFERDNLTFVVKGVPADICDNCGEEYVDEETTAKLLATSEEVAKAAAQVDIREYRAA